MEHLIDTESTALPMAPPVPRVVAGDLDIGITGELGSPTSEVIVVRRPDGLGLLICSPDDAIDLGRQLIEAGAVARHVGPAEALAQSEETPC